MNDDLELKITFIIAIYLINTLHSVYWCRNFPNRRFVIIKNKVIFKLLGGSQRSRNVDDNILFYPENKVTLSGFCIHIINIITMLQLIIFDLNRYLTIYILFYFAIIVIICLGTAVLEFAVYTVNKNKLPKQICFNNQISLNENSESIYKYSNEILIDKQKRYYIFVEDTTNFENIGLLKLTKSGEVLELTYKTRKEVDEMWKTHIRFNSYFKDREIITWRNS